MNQKHKQIWKLALPYLRKGRLKDFVVHTEGVVKAMEMLLKKEKDKKDILIPAAILHDVGWAKVPKMLQQKTLWQDKAQLEKAMKLHLKYVVPITEDILTNLKYEKDVIKEIIGVIKSHKFENPREDNKKLLIDADNLSDILKDQFWSDVKEYNVSPQEQYEFRKSNKFYTKIAQKIFEKELKERKKEINKIKIR